MSLLQKNLHEVQSRINASAIRSGRDPSNIQLIAVSKTKPVDAIQDLYQAGQKSFGENYSQEFLEKKSFLSNFSDLNIDWHFIGSLQRRKIKGLVGEVSLIHSVDSLEHLQEIQKKAIQKNIVQRVLIQVNVGAEATKGGIAPEHLVSFFKKVAESKLTHVKCDGLMAIPPPSSVENETREYFRTLKSLRDEVNQQTGMQLKELSMGMSHDFEMAIEEGATIVRVGTALFGERVYS